MDPTTQEDTETLKSAMQRLKNLNTLKDNKLISLQEFETRKSQIVDELTGTSASYVSKTKNDSNTYKRKTIKSTLTTIENGSNERKVNEYGSNNGDIIGIENDNNNKKHSLVVHRHDPPDWNTVRSEKAEKWTFIYETQEWKTENIKVKIDEQPFDKGGLRYVFHLQDLTNPNERWVAKMSQDMRDNIRRDIYFNDVRMQCIAKYFCHGPKGYNSYKPPKEVDFLDSFVLNLKQRQGSPVCHVERYIQGDYKKYNNNVGWINNDDDRNTPQAFAHFTYEASKRTLLVCDIQGVNDIYTDPQVHSSDNLKAFGRGNLGKKGFENFLRTHRCNPICRYKIYIYNILYCFSIYYIIL